MDNTLFQEMLDKGLIDVVRTRLSVALASSIPYRTELVAFYGMRIERLEPEDFNAN